MRKNAATYTTAFKRVIGILLNWHISTAILTRIARAFLVKFPVELYQFTRIPTTLWKLSYMLQSFCIILLQTFCRRTYPNFILHSLNKHSSIQAAGKIVIECIYKSGIGSGTNCNKSEIRKKNQNLEQIRVWNKLKIGTNHKLGQIKNFDKS